MNNGTTATAVNVPEVQLPAYVPLITELFIIIEIDQVS